MRPCGSAGPRRIAVLGAAAVLACATLTAAHGETGTARAACAATPPEGASTAWGEPIWCEEFDDQLNVADWVVADATGHAGNGRRTPDQAYIGGGALFLHGTAEGATAAVGTRYVQAHGRWEARIRLYEGAGWYHPTALLWPQNGGGHVESATGEEIGWLEVADDPERRRPAFRLTTPDGKKDARADVDATEYHVYAVESTPQGVVGYLDGREWFRSPLTTSSPMAAWFELDWFPDGRSKGEAWMEVDWVRIYPMPR